jgi:hypothetical protein
MVIHFLEKIQGQQEMGLELLILLLEQQKCKQLHQVEVEQEVLQVDIRVIVTSRPLVDHTLQMPDMLNLKNGAEWYKWQIQQLI